MRNLAERPTRTLAAISYVGKGSARRLPLKPGDRLLVDMSTQALRQGLTDPREIGRFMEKGVEVYSRRALHAKFIVSGITLIAGSANASRNSEEILDEAAILCTSAVAARRAREVFRNWCTEPIFPGRLAEALKEYRPPRFKPMRGLPTRRPAPGMSHGPIRARLWIVAGLRPIDPQGEERKRIENAQRRAAAGFRRRRGTSLSYVRYFRAPMRLRFVRRNDWVVQECEGEVSPPARVAGKRSYGGAGKGSRWLLVLEERDSGTDVKWTRFRKAARKILGASFGKSKRSRPVTSNRAAEEILRMWSMKTGRPLKKFFG